MSGPGGIGYGSARHDGERVRAVRRRRRRRAARPRRSTARARRSRPASRRGRRPRSARARSAARKSTSRKRGSLPSAWKPAAADGRRQVVHLADVDAIAVASRVPERARLERAGRGRGSGGGVNLISSFETWPSGANGGSRSSRWLRPFSSMITDQPGRGEHVGRGRARRARCRRSPRRSRGQSRPADLLVGVAAGLDVAGELDRRPAAAVAVAAVLGRAVARPRTRARRAAAVNSGTRVEPAVLLVAVDRRRSRRRARRCPSRYSLLPAGDRSVELALGDALRALDPGAPGELLEPAERDERRRTTPSPPDRPENGPPAQIRGGSTRNAPSSPSM